MADTITDVQIANSTMFYPAVPDRGTSLAIEALPDGEYVTINDRQIPIIDEEFKISVVQSASTKGDKTLNKHIGDVRLHLGEDPADDDFYEELFLVPICIVGYRWDKYGQYDPSKPSTPLCSSSDGRFPYVRNGVTPVNDRCAEYTILKNGDVKVTRICPAAKWDGETGRPTCQQSMKVAFLTLPEAIPVVMSLHGTGLSGFNNFMKQRRKAISVAKIKHKKISRCVVRLYSENMPTYSAIKFDLQEAPEEYGQIDGYVELARFYRDTLFAPKNVDSGAQADFTEEPTAADVDAELVDDI